MRESITISVRPTSSFTCTPAVFNLFQTDHHHPDTTLPSFGQIYTALPTKRLIKFVFNHKQVSFFASALFFFYCYLAVRGPGFLEGSSSMKSCVYLTIGRRRLWNISDSPLYSRCWRIDALNAGCLASSHHCTPASWHILIILQYGCH